MGAMFGFMLKIIAINRQSVYRGGTIKCLYNKHCLDWNQVHL